MMMGPPATETDRAGALTADRVREAVLEVEAIGVVVDDSGGQTSVTRWVLVVVAVLVRMVENSVLLLYGLHWP